MKITPTLLLGKIECPNKSQGGDLSPLLFTIQIDEIIKISFSN